MNYRVIISGEGCDDITLDTKGVPDVVKRINIMSDTVEANIKDRSTNILSRITIEGAIKGNPEVKTAYKQLMKWSLTSGDNTVHRTVKIEIKDNNGNVIRYVEVPMVFCEDYFENYAEVENDCHYELKLIQKAGYLDKIEQDVE